MQLNSLGKMCRNFIKFHPTIGSTSGTLQDLALSAITLVLTNPTRSNCQNYFQVEMVTGGNCSVFRKF